jgi:hypothetical protein
LLFDDAALALAFDGFAGTAGCDLACLHELANVSGRVRYVGGQAVWNSRLEEAVAAFELLVLVLDDFDAIDNLHKACLKLLGLSDTIG